MGVVPTHRAVRLTAELKPFNELTEIVLVPVEPWVIAEGVRGLAVIEKSGVVTTVNVSGTA